MTVWLTLGLLLQAAVLVMLAPGNPILDLNQRRYQAVGTVLSHAAVGLLLLGLWGRRRTWLEAAWRLPPDTRRRWLAIAAIGPHALVLAVALVWPAYARALLREWGLHEPLTAAFLLVAGFLAWEMARLRRAHGEEYRPYQAAMALGVLLCLEEVDYLGLPALFVGRIGRVYVGSSHDLVNVALHYPIIWAFLAAAGAAILIGLWWGGYLTWSFVRREAWGRASIPLYAGAIVVAVAEVIDTDADTLAWAGIPSLGMHEEPLELLGASLLALGVLAKYFRDRARLERPAAARRGRITGGRRPGARPPAAV
ncbi:MAG TPA: hypothetical protein VML54_04805 [Candidatus Limnocylindrales bacterium]|nr:hypothetical protein [Candidatus Limnocylindrales bacterium]